MPITPLSSASSLLASVEYEADQCFRHSAQISTLQQSVDWHQAYLTLAKAAEQLTQLRNQELRASAHRAEVTMRAAMRKGTN